VPILKLQDCRTKTVTTDDFRGIAISPIISKVFEYCVLDRFETHFETVENQFGFKRGLGCSHAIYAVRKIVDRFVNNGSTINMCTIDLSKAYDKVNHSALYIQLMKRQIPNELLSTLENMFDNCYTCVKWKSVMSRSFKIEFGVRQGSVLSPFLFAIYINDVVKHLALRQKLFIVLYADDILMLAPSVTELQRLLNACEQELLWLDMCINVKKSCCIRVGPRHDQKCADITLLSGTALPWVNEIRYLGIFVVRSSYFKCSLDHAKRSFYRSVNSIFCKVGRAASEEVVLQLVNSKCLPVLLYGLEACPLNKSDKHSLDFAVTRFLMKLFSTANIEIINECRICFNFKLPSEILLERTVKFKNKFDLCKII